MGEDDIGKDSDKDIGSTKDASDKVSDKMRDASRDVSGDSLVAAAKYDSIKAACVSQFGPMNGPGWLSLNDPDTFNARTKALASGTPSEIEKAINNNMAGAKNVQQLLPAIGARLAMVARTASVES